MCVARACEPRSSLPDRLHRRSCPSRIGGRSAIAIADIACPPRPKSKTDLPTERCASRCRWGALCGGTCFLNQPTPPPAARTPETQPLRSLYVASPPAPHRLLDNRHAPARPPHHQSKTRHSGDCVRGACERSGRCLRRRQVRGGRAGREPRGVARHRASEGLVLAVAVVTLAAVSGDAASDLLRLVA